MKWNNRLKTVLSTPAKSGFSADCLEMELTKAVKTSLNGVSSAFVSDEFRHSPKNPKKSDNGEEQSNLVSSAFVSAYSRDSLKTKDDLAQFEADTFHAVLNRFIADGITFEVSADDFQTIDGVNLLKKSDKEFLKLNGAAILCHLQQSLLTKHLFSHAPERFEDFAFEVTERESLLTITAKTPFEIYLFAVKDVTKKCFAELLSPHCSNCDLPMRIIDAGNLWFCPLGCESRKRRNENA